LSWPLCRVKSVQPAIPGVLYFCRMKRLVQSAVRPTVS